MDMPEFLRGGRMIRFHTPFDGKRFIGDKKKMVFHDSLHESIQDKAGGCQIDRIAPEQVVTFDPDSPAEAILQGLAPCLECLWIEPHALEHE
jgi:hypothetical protein